MFLKMGLCGGGGGFYGGIGVGFLNILFILPELKNMFSFMNLKLKIFNL